MYYVRRRRDNKYLYYINQESTSYSELRSAIPLNTIEMATEFKHFAELHDVDETFEIVNVLVTITAVDESEK